MTRDRFAGTVVLDQITWQKICPALHQAHGNQSLSEVAHAHLAPVKVRKGSTKPVTLVISCCSAQGALWTGSCFAWQTLEETINAVTHVVTHVVNGCQSTYLELVNADFSQFASLRVRVT